MDIKVKHRILGIVVIAGLAILAYPFVISKDPSKEAIALTKAPPFPDQAIQVTTSEIDATTPYENDDDVSATDKAVDQSSNHSEDKQDNAAQVNHEQTTTSNDKKDQSVKSNQLHAAKDGVMTHDPDDTIEHTDNMIIDIKAPTLISPPEIPDNATGIMEDDEEEVEEIVTGSIDAVQQDELKLKQRPDGNMVQSVKKLVQKKNSTKKLATPAKQMPAKVKHIEKVKPLAKTKKSDVKNVVAHKVKAPAKSKTKLTVQKPVIYSKLLDKRIIPSYSKMPLDENGLFSLKSAAWVIQLGSFKDKANALRLVNQLRSKGYRAFIQKYATASGDHTRVFVGPEKQQESARIVAAELNANMKLRGIVISYKPFKL